MQIIRTLGLGALLGLAALTAAPQAHANEIEGNWQRADTGASRIRFSKCGEAFCASLTWLKDPNGPAKVGQRVFYDMKPDGAARWAGKAFNPEDGKTYTGKASISGNTLTTQGCIAGGLICKSVSWTRLQ